MSSSSLTFEINQTEKSARTGILRHARGQLETPGLLVFTMRGSPLFLTPDMMAELGPEGQNFVIDGTKL